MRDALQQFVYKIINPLIHCMIKIGITPNMVTTIGFLGNVAGACVLVYAGIHADTDPYKLIGWAGGIIFISSLFDMMDGQVARLGNMTSTWVSNRCSHYFCSTYRLINGKLCTCTCRRIGIGVQNRFYATPRARGFDKFRAINLWRHCYVCDKPTIRCHADSDCTYGLYRYLCKCHSFCPNRIQPPAINEK